MADRPVVAEKPGNAGGAKGPWFKSNAIRNKGPEIGASLQTPKWVWQFQTALDAQAKSERLVREGINSLERKPDALAGHVRFDERGVVATRKAQRARMAGRPKCSNGTQRVTNPVPERLTTTGSEFCVVARNGGTKRKQLASKPCY